MRFHLTALALVALAFATSAEAVPDLRRPIEAGPFPVFRDHERPDLFYYAPGKLSLATDRAGRPGLRFLQVRYVGTALYGNEGDSGSYSTLNLRFRLDAPRGAELAALRRGLGRALGRKRVELRPLPVTRFEAALVYASVAPGSESRPLPDGHFEAEDVDDARTGREGFWKERNYTVSLDRHTSELFWDALQKGDLVMSLAYVFWTRGRGHDGEVHLSVKRESSDAMQMLLERLGLAEPDALDALAEKFEEEAEERLSEKMIQAGALAVRVDAQRWPDLFQRVDFNDKAPPGYAHLRVYCYDFKDRLRDDLFYKKIEIAARAVGGQEVTLDAKFLASQPDLYARSVRFPVAVEVDQPYRYRVVVARRDGEIEEGPWIEQAAWGRILDVTTRPSEAEGDADAQSQG